MEYNDYQEFREFKEFQRMKSQKATGKISVQRSTDKSQSTHNEDTLDYFSQTGPGDPWDKGKDDDPVHWATD